MKKSERTLKVYYSTQERDHGSYHKIYKKVPTIILKGQWLEQFGFQVGDKIQVSYAKNERIISKISQE